MEPPLAGYRREVMLPTCTYGKITNLFKLLFIKVF